MFDDILDHPYIGAGADEVSLLEQADRERPVRFIGRDKTVIQLKTEKPLHWTEQEAMGLKRAVFDPREFGDNDKSSPEQNLEEK